MGGLTQNLDSFGSGDGNFIGVALCQSAGIYNHIGVFVKNFENDEHYLLHLAWHYDLRFHGLSIVKSDEYRWVKLFEVYGEDNARDFYFLCKEIFKMNEGKIKYGVKLDKAFITKDTNEISFEKGEGVGLTCATFAYLVFKRWGVELLDLPTWQTRESDIDWHKYIVHSLEKYGAESNHVEQIRSEQGCSRIRPEEVAASCVLSPKPVVFNSIESLGAEITNEIPRLS
ncbi:MAG: hypothetical protein ACPGLV_00485 [Bacteroidia bacterium]